MDLYTCDLCGYRYDPEYGDEENHIDRGTAFEKLPPDWVCPECSASKDDFYKPGDDNMNAYDTYDAFDNDEADEIYNLSFEELD